MIVIQAPEFARLKSEADKFDKAIIRSLRKRLKKAGEGAVAAVKKAVLEEPPGGGDESVGSREAVADSTRVVTSFSARGGGVKITTTNARLDSDHKGFAAAYNKRSFRHPVYGSNTWVTQQGRPYFGASIEPFMSDEMGTEMKAAIDDAVRAMGGRVF